MALAPRLDLRQSQSLVMTPQLQQAIKLLALSNLELEAYLAEALEYIAAWKQATSDNPVGICGPIGPTEQLPLVARLVNELGLSLRHAHFWGMDECRAHWDHPGKN